MSDDTSEVRIPVAGRRARVEKRGVETGRFTITSSISERTEHVATEPRRPQALRRAVEELRVRGLRHPRAAEATVILKATEVSVKRAGPHRGKPDR
jgi:hypothetical protein